MKIEHQVGEKVIVSFVFLDLDVITNLPVCDYENKEGKIEVFIAMNYEVAILLINDYVVIKITSIKAKLFKHDLVVVNV